MKIHTIGKKKKEQTKKYEANKSNSSNNPRSTRVQINNEPHSIAEK
jgi:hypothetical protein